MLYAIVVIAVAAIAIAISAMSLNAATDAPSSGTKIRVVAAENFWGSLAGQVCGANCNVTSMITDPNTDPHDYEASASDARDVANARLVIVNGLGYDGWALKLVSAGHYANRTILNVAQLVKVQNGSNPHLWYSPDYVNSTVKQIYLDLVEIDPGNASYYRQRYMNVTESLGRIDSVISSIRQRFGGTMVASTESVFVYLANATGLDIISPNAFMDAVAEGNDPPVQSVVEFQNQLDNRSASILVYNEQTVTPLTQQMKQIAASQGIRLVGITETMQPANATFQEWMGSELDSLQRALNYSVSQK